mmetsp:Transcript_19663/g.55287  ORF Transcript_19663/g.55287 Transcript_19663/m.55287 type:complete len:216 (+) Transcript_19663:87-734(+)|eukprot:CAMPEP_0179298396 /NCGR_PEP_ID=MMETSP0797-20121207/45969_1 /TAXON_ID=47934 /ORGANISM="Dinophysis acuminata, Strain DAEP01" /LENGTH=215 /DNA_ID=CAMNT_0021007777 /DNA_START=44 /DNA_END=691 /DNA_ORIENTATION=-
MAGLLECVHHNNDVSSDLHACNGMNTMMALSTYSTDGSGALHGAADGADGEKDWIHLDSDSSTKADSDVDELPHDVGEDNELEGIPFPTPRQLLPRRAAADASPLAAFQEDVLEAVSTPDFQMEIASLLRDEAGPDAADHMRAVAGREELCLAALRHVLPKHGFGCTPQGLQAALRRLENPPVQSNRILNGTMAIFDCLGLAPEEPRVPVPWEIM